MIWELRNSGIKEFSVLVTPIQDETSLKLFSCDGQPKSWAERPKLIPALEPRKKKAKPRADISYFWPGSVVLNRRAFQALHGVLQNFGQLLELDCCGEIEYFYNVTTLVNCIDREKSEFEFGAIKKEIFLPGFDGPEPLIFKDPLTASPRIYLNQSAREQIDAILARENLTGLKFVEPGSRPY